MAMIRADICRGFSRVRIHAGLRGRADRCQRGARGPRTGGGACARHRTGPAPICTTSHTVHLATLLDSAFVTESGPMYFWFALPGGACWLWLN